MNFIFFKKGFNKKDEKAYGYMIADGNLINGFASLKERKIFINLPVIKTFSELYQTIQHETLHLATRLNSKPINEKIIEVMVE